MHCAMCALLLGVHSMHGAQPESPRGALERDDWCSVSMTQLTLSILTKLGVQAVHFLLAVFLFFSPAYRHQTSAKRHRLGWYKETIP